MTALCELKSLVFFLTFDLYGTILDMQKGLAAAIAPYLAAKSWEGRPETLVTWWRRAHFENSMIDALIARGHTPFREISRRALGYSLERAGIAHTEEEVRRLVAEIERLEPFPDALPALERLGRRYRLAVLSNGDPDMLERAMPHIGFAFDEVISVAEAGAFKPHREAYRHAAERLGAEPGRVMHVASHAFDCIGAKAAGFLSGFVNRRHLPYEDTPYRPDLVVFDLEELAELLA